MAVDQLYSEPLGAIWRRSVMDDQLFADICGVLERLAEELSKLQGENAQLRKKVAELLKQLEETDRSASAESRELASLRVERTELLARVERIREHVAALEKPIQESIV